MSDTLSGWFEEVDRPQEKVQFPEVTAIVKYDSFPYYNVFVGQLRMDGGVSLESKRYVRQESVIAVFPKEAFDTQSILWKQLKNSYRDQERQLRIDILKQHGVDFVTVP